MSIPESGGGGVRANHRVVARSAWFWMMAMGCLMAGAQELPPMDVVKFAGLSPEAAAKEMTLPPGFKATLFAGEPDVRQPISFAIDHRGRLWVAEAYTYPIRAPEGQGKDRILIFEDTDGDGKFDKRTVFIEGLNLVSGLEVGFGGVWVGAAPYLMFIPVKEGEDKPAGEPQILLDGWAYQDTHETLNTFAWGPDGWLYGCQGVFTHSNVGKPGAPSSERTPINAGVWRYHPIRHTFELFAEGTSNPWGIDFDEHGQCLIEACVIPHLFHMVQGGRYQRQAGQHFNPFIFDDIKTIADHLHWLGDKGPWAVNGRAGTVGGGHAHAGLMAYLGGSWPEKYRGQVFMNNIHGSRINMDILERAGSGFIGRHGPDFINFNDSWSQILNLRYDQDGSVYMIDWYDKNQCHHNDPAGHDRSNGRIFKVIYNNTPWTPVDLTKLSDEELVQLQLRKNDWYVRHARGVLQERAQARGRNPQVQRSLQGILQQNPDPSRQLRALWALHVTGGLTEEVALSQLNNADEFVRAWAVQLLTENQHPSISAVRDFARLAREDPSPVVRLYVAAAMQRTPVDQRWDVLKAFSRRGEDQGDQNIPLMTWYAAEPMATVDFNRALELAIASRMPRMLDFATRRVSALGHSEAFEAIVRQLGKLDDAPKQLEMLSGLGAALKGRRSAPMPKGWETVASRLSGSASPEVRTHVQSLSLTFGSVQAVEALRKILGDPAAGLDARQTALDSLLGAKEASLPSVLQSLLKDPGLRSPALRGLAMYEDPGTPVAILSVYNSLKGQEKRDALNTLSARATFAQPLLAAVGRGDLPAKDLTSDLVRQLRNLKNREVDQAIQKVWGIARETTADKQKEIERYKQIYRAGGSQPGDGSRGRMVFSRICQQCHTLFGIGGKVGPDLTGSNRGDLDYILQNIVDPNAVIPNDYRASTLETTDDRIVTGIVKNQDAQAVTILTANETLVIPRKEIKSLQQSEVSMMPEGLLNQLGPQEVRDLLYYLGRPAQAPLPAMPETSQ